jgi:hypothetical protein
MLNTPISKADSAPARIGVRNLVDLNKLNTEFWARENTVRDERIGDPLLLELLRKRLCSPTFSLTPVYYQNSIEQILHDAAEQKRTFLKYCETSIRQSARTEQARQAGKKKKPDALQQIIVDLAHRNPSITGTQLLGKLRDHPDVSEVTETEIDFDHRIGSHITTKTVRISGLKDRLSRAKKKLNSR